MSEKNSLRPVIESLEKLFSKFNGRFFESKLSKPIITVSPGTAKNTYGWCTGWKAWKEGENAKEIDGYYEINMCAEYISRPFEDVCSTLLHEMVHLLNLENGVKETSRNRTYHNNRFKTSAEEHGLLCELSETYGWSKTTPTPETLKYFHALDNESFIIYRTRQIKEGKKSKQSTRKYFCPKCGNIVRATKEVRIKCQDCDALFELVC